MKWFELKILTTQDATEAICEMLKENGASGISEVDPFEVNLLNNNPELLNIPDFNGFDEDFLSQLGDDVIIKAYYNDETDISGLEELIKEKLAFISQFLPIGKGFASISEVDDEDWATSWKQYYKPIEITKRVVIKPTWEEYLATQDQVVVDLDPGMAFGTGTHETTQLCLEQLENFVVPTSEILDIGCGSGILSIASILLGASHADAIDVDPKAVQIAAENATVNNLSTNQYHAFTGNILSDDQGHEYRKYDIILANIVADIIIALNKKIKPFMHENSVYIMSGIIEPRFDDVVESLRQNGLVIIEATFKRDWCCIIAKLENINA